MFTNAVTSAEHKQPYIWRRARIRPWKKYSSLYKCIFWRPTDVRIQRLKSALWFSVGKIVDEETLRLGVNATPQFIGALTELVWAQIGRLQLPLIARSRANANTIYR